MMKSLRKGVSGWMAKILLGLVVFAFVVTGFSGFFGGAAPSTVLSAGGTDVNQQDYRLAYRQAEIQIEDRLQRRITREEAAAQGIDRRVMSQLVAEAVLDEQGRLAGLGLSEDRLLRVIAEDPAFHDQAGRFSRPTFTQLLSSIGMTENDFIRNREQAAVRSQIVDAVSEGAAAPSIVKQAFGLHNGERRTVEFLTLPVSLVEPVADPAADVLQTYFDANKTVYRAPEFRGLAYATLTADAIADPSTITEEAIAADYERSAARFTTPERRRIEQIVYADRAAADAAKASLAGGKLFEQLIIESGRTVGDALLGTLTKSDIPDPSIADAAFALPQNQVSGVVDGAFGPVLLRVTEIQPEAKRPLEEVKEDLRRELALAAAADGVQQAYDAFEDARAGGSNLEEAATLAGLPVKTIPDVSARGEAPDGSPVEGLPAAAVAEVLAGAFQAEVGFENPPIGLPDNGYLFYDVTKIDPARERSLDEVRDRVLADWKRSEASRLLAERADALKARREAGETLDAIAASENLTKDVANGVTRVTGTAQLGPAGIKAAFSGPKGLVTTSVAGDGTSRLLIDVTDVAAPMEPVAELQPSEVEQLATMIRTDFLQSYISLLQADYDVAQYPAAIQAAQAQLR